MSGHRERLFQGSRSLRVDAASRALRGDADAVEERTSGPLAAEIAGLFERARSWARGGSEVVALELKAIAAVGKSLGVTVLGRAAGDARGPMMPPALARSRICVPGSSRRSSPACSSAHHHGPVGGERGGGVGARTIEALGEMRLT